MKISAVLKLFLLLQLVGCGSTINEYHEKRYVLAYEGDNSSISQQFRQLIEEFNREAGYELIEYTNDQSRANSFIRLTPGLENRDEKIGWGQWITSTSDDETLTHKGQKIDRTITYKMDIELDWDYVVSRAGANLTSDRYYELKKLVFHEIGHGLKMPHSEDPNNLMYETINGKKDFDEFFSRVRIFFGV